MNEFKRGRELPSAKQEVYRDRYGALTRLQREQFLDNDPAIFESTLADSIDPQEWPLYLLRAMVVGNLELIHWLCERMGANQETFDTLIENNPSLVEALPEFSIDLSEWSRYLLRADILNNPAEFTQMLYQHVDRDPHVQESDSFSRVTSHLESNIDPYVWPSYLLEAVIVGDIALVKWLCKRVYVDQDTFDAAVKSNNFPLVSWLLESGVAQPLSRFSRSPAISSHAESGFCEPALVDLLQSKSLLPLPANAREPYLQVLCLLLLVVLILIALTAEISVIGFFVIALGLGALILAKKALLPFKKPFAITLGCYAIAIYLSVMLPLVVAGATYVVTLASLVGVMVILAAGWVASILYSAPINDPEPKKQMAGFLAVFAVVAAAVTYGEAFASYRGFAGVVVGSVIVAGVLATAAILFGLAWRQRAGPPHCLRPGPWLAPPVKNDQVQRIEMQSVSSLAHESKIEEAPPHKAYGNQLAVFSAAREVGSVTPSYDAMGFNASGYLAPMEAASRGLGADELNLHIPQPSAPSPGARDNKYPLPYRRLHFFQDSTDSESPPIAALPVPVGLGV